MGAKRLYPGISNNQVVKIIVTKKSYDALYIVKVKEISNIKNKNHREASLIIMEKFYYQFLDDYRPLKSKLKVKLSETINFPMLDSISIEVL